MNSKTTLAIAFLLAGTLLSGTTAMAPVFAENDDDDKRHDNDKRHDKGGDGNKQKVEDESAGAIADCDKNEVERADFDCFANAATEDSEINTGGGEDGGMGPGPGPGPGDGAEECNACIEAFLTATADFGLIDEQELLIDQAFSVFGDCEGDFTEEDVEILATTLTAILAAIEGGPGAVSDLEECLDALLEGAVV